MENNENFPTFEEKIVFRLFINERKRILVAIKHAKTIKGFRKYDNESHFIRCAVINLLREVEREQDIKPGRPKTKGEEYEN